MAQGHASAGVHRSVQEKVTMGIKQVIVVRKDLNMRKGKIAAQVAHASMAFLTQQIFIPDDEPFANRCGKMIVRGMTLDRFQAEWCSSNFRKIVAYVESQKELCDLQDKAADAGISIYPIIDAGLTEFKEPTLTCCAFGPDENEKLDAITGHLKLL